MQLYLNERTAAQEKRHGSALLAPDWTSLQQLIDIVRDKCPPETPIPSRYTVRLQFTPTNKFTYAALKFTSRFDLQYKIQKKTLREAHPDNHFCSALFKYLREYIIINKPNALIYFVDDKCKIPLGEPSSPVSALKKQRPSIAGCSEVLNALDHDTSSKSLLTPSVMLKPAVPDMLEHSWYQGYVP